MHFSVLRRIAYSLLFWSASASAVGTLNDCYKDAHLLDYASAPEMSTVVLLDETTLFDHVQQQHIVEQVVSLIQPGYELGVFSFSAFIGGRYTQPVLEHVYSSPIGAAIRETIRKPSLSIFDRCLRIQKYEAEGQIRRSLAAYFARSSDGISKSDIVATIHDVGASVVAKSKAKAKRILIISDMLENSDITSFYLRGNLRHIDAKREMALFQDRGMVTDMRGAMVYVIGAGVVPTDPSKPNTDRHRDQAALRGLKEFWKSYFEKSNAHVVEFGEPLLLRAIQAR